MKLLADSSSTLREHKMVVYRNKKVKFGIRREFRGAALYERTSCIKANDYLDFDSSHFCSPLPIFTCLGGNHESNSTFNSVTVLVSMRCLPLPDPLDCGPPGFSVRGILQARTLEWAAIPFSRDSSQARGRTQVTCLAGHPLPSEPPGNPVMALSKHNSHILQFI